jgi:hypothetical protein
MLAGGMIEPQARDDACRGVARITDDGDNCLSHWPVP